jgi:hypothetical protein
MSRLLDWLLRGRCLRHRDPLFDRDRAGLAVFRCPRCLATWPILPDLQTRLVSGRAMAHQHIATFDTRRPTEEGACRHMRVNRPPGRHPLSHPSFQP